jgi:hypothetical protein
VITALLTPTPRLTFCREVAGYLHEGAHILYWLVHPFCPVLALGLARGSASAGRLVDISTVSPPRHDRERRVCLDSRGVVFAGEIAGWKKDLVENVIWSGEKKVKAGRHSLSIGDCRSP